MRTPQFTIRWMMILIAIVAANLALVTAMMQLFPGAGLERWLAAAGVVLLYDFLFGMSVRILLRIVRTPAFEGFRWTLFGVTAAVIFCFVGLPFWALLMSLSGPATR